MEPTSDYSGFSLGRCIWCVEGAPPPPLHLKNKKSVGMVHDVFLYLFE
jgi:hypothetical protein